MAAVTIEVNQESKLLPFFVPMPKCADAQEGCSMCGGSAQGSTDHVMTATCISLQDLGLCESVSSPTRKFEIYVGRRTLHCHTLQLISHPPMA